MKYNYCTLFDKGFLNRFIALHDSFEKYHKDDYRHYVLCLDNETLDILTEMNLPHVIPVRRSDFESSELLEVKKTRSLREYSWTLSSVFTKYVLDHFENIEMVAYVDADLYFYDSPEIIFEDFERANASILIIPHNLPSWKKQKEEAVGKYNVAFNIFRNDENGRACLNWWAESCIKWCYEIVEPSRFADQKYLDYFKEKFNGVFVYNNKGANLAPWNIKNFVGKIKEKHDSVYVDGDKLIFFHFSSFKLFFPKSFILPSSPVMGTYADYILPSIERKLIYSPYTVALYKAMDKIRAVRPNFIFGTLPRPNFLIQIKDIILPIAIDSIKISVKKNIPLWIIERIGVARNKP